MKKEKYEAPKAVVVDFENDYVMAAGKISPGGKGATIG